jgi:hypothetical protein
MDDYTGPLTNIDIRFGDLEIHVDTRANWTPDMIDDGLLKARRQLIAGARQLGMTAVEADALTESDG